MSAVRKRWVVSEVERSRGTLSGEIRSAGGVFPDSRAGRHPGTGAGHFRGCGEGGSGRNERSGRRFDVKASLSRRWPGCGIHGTERAVVSARVGCALYSPGRQAVGSLTDFTQGVLRRFPKISLTCLGEGSTGNCEINCERVEIRPPQRQLSSSMTDGTRGGGGVGRDMCGRWTSCSRSPARPTGGKVRG